jgi:hypothetical protein
VEYWLIPFNVAGAVKDVEAVGMAELDEDNALDVVPISVSYLLIGSSGGSMRPVTYAETPTNR